MEIRTKLNKILLWNHLWLSVACNILCICTNEYQGEFYWLDIFEAWIHLNDGYQDYRPIREFGMFDAYK